MENYYLAGNIETYDANGSLQSVADRNGLVEILAYSTAATSVAPNAGMLLSVTDSYGRSLNFTYNAAAQMVTMTGPSGNITRYSYDANGNLSTVTYPDNTPDNLTDNPKKTYVYGELAFTANVSQPNALTGIIDENGFRYATYQYDVTGKAISTEHATGGTEKYSLSYSTDNAGNPVTTVTDPLGTARTTHYTHVLGVLKSTGTDQPGGSGCAASSNALSYDANGNIASRTDFNGNRTNYTYDLTRNLETSRTEGLTATGATTPETRTITTAWIPLIDLVPCWL